MKLINRNKKKEKNTKVVAVSPSQYYVHGVICFGVNNLIPILYISVGLT